MGYTCCVGNILAVAGICGVGEAGECGEIMVNTGYAALGKSGFPSGSAAAYPHYSSLTAL